MKQDLQEDIQERLEKVNALEMWRSSVFLTEQWKRMMCGMDWVNEEIVVEDDSTYSDIQEYVR